MVEVKKPTLLDVKSRMREIGYRYTKQYTGTYGIEIETETKNIEDYPDGWFNQNPTTGRYDVPITGWEGHVDNSLRNFGMEYVLQKPLSFKEAMSALDAFGEATEGIPFIKNTPSTSVHVHINMLPERPVTMMNFLTLYTLFENVLVDYSGESRRSNLFALPMRVAGTIHENVTRLMKVFETGRGAEVCLDPRQVKYSALNVAPINTFGSLEIRSFRGETDVSEIKDWLSILNRILEYARRDGLTPSIILLEYKVQGISYFETVFEDMAEKISSRVNDISDLIERNLWFVFRMTLACKDWASLDFPKEKPKPKKVDGVFYLTPSEFEEFEVQPHQQVEYDEDQNLFVVMTPHIPTNQAQAPTGWTNTIAILDELNEPQVEEGDED